MFTNKHILAILAGLTVVAMLAEGPLVARIKKASIVHDYHGVLDGKVGQPYQQLVQKLLACYEAGNIDALGRALKSAGARKHVRKS